jgi:hypothetical protein
MFHLNHIEVLLEKYWEGDTTLEEERLLKTYFASNEVAENLRLYAPLFQVLREEQTVQFSRQNAAADLKPAQYNWKPWAVAASLALLLSAGWWWSVQPDSTQQYAAKTIETPAVHPAPKKEILAPGNTPVTSMSTLVAAVARKKRINAKPAKSPQINKEEEQAIAEIKAALALVSSKLSKGRREAAKGASHLDNVDRIFKKKKDS